MWLLATCLQGKLANHIISACVNIGLPLNIDRGVNIVCDIFLHLLYNTFY